MLQMAHDWNGNQILINGKWTNIKIHNLCWTVEVEINVC